MDTESVKQKMGIIASKYREDYELLRRTLLAMKKSPATAKDLYSITGILVGHVTSLHSMLTLENQLLGGWSIPEKDHDNLRLILDTGIGYQNDQHPLIGLCQKLDTMNPELHLANLASNLVLQLSNLILLVKQTFQESIGEQYKEPEGTTGQPSEPSPVDLGQDMTPRDIAKAKDSILDQFSKGTISKEQMGERMREFAKRNPDVLTVLGSSFMNFSLSPKKNRKKTQYIPDVSPLHLGSSQGLNKEALFGWGKDKKQAPIVDPNYNEHIAQTTKDPMVLKRILAHNRDDIVSQLAAANPYCPAEELDKIITAGLAKRKITYTMLHAMRNRNCPPHIFSDIVRRKVVDELTYEALKNPSLPRGLIVELADATNDETILVKLLAAPNCPQEIKDKIALGPRDKASTAMAAKICSEETLRKLLAEFKSDSVSFNGLKNHAVTPAMIYGIVSRGENDQISHLAAVHPLCPQEVIGIVLERGMRDKLSQILSSRKDCPADLKQKWMEDAGLIKKELSPEEIAKLEQRKKREEDLKTMKILGE